MNPIAKYLFYLSSLPLAFLIGCGGPPCGSLDDCPLGSHCVLDISGGSFSGSCQSDCLRNSDCPTPEGESRRAICDNLGQCRVESIPPRLSLEEPEPDVTYPEDTRLIRVAGVIETSASEVEVRVTTQSLEGCFGNGLRRVTIQNPIDGKSRIPFSIDQIRVDPGKTKVFVEAVVGGASRRREVEISVACPGCAKVQLSAPTPNSAVNGLILPRIQGTISSGVRQAIWRVYGESGGVLDGTLLVQGGSFSQTRIPIFAGTNRIEVSASGVGSGQAISRCTVGVGSSLAQEKGLRLLLSWNSLSDLDLHLVGPNGRYGDPMSTLSNRSPQPFFSGKVVDDYDGYGPEVLTADNLPAGTYGVIVEPTFDPGFEGSTAWLRVLMDGRLLSPRADGPQHLSAQKGELWVVGTLRVESGGSQWNTINEIVPAAMPPTTDPSLWPQFY